MLVDKKPWPPKYLNKYTKMTEKCYWKRGKVKSFWTWNTFIFAGESFRSKWVISSSVKMHLDAKSEIILSLFV